MDVRKIDLNEDDKNGARKFVTNYIRTTKYTMFSFLPLAIAY